MLLLAVGLAEKKQAKVDARQRLRDIVENIDSGSAALVELHEAITMGKEVLDEQDEILISAKGLAEEKQAQSDARDRLRKAIDNIESGSDAFVELQEAITKGRELLN